MHGAVLQNKKYIKFADDNTVEVISLGRLEEGREKGDARAGTYEAKDGTEYMVEFPNLTYDEMIALRRSKAASYNDTGKIPFTCLVDPYTLKEITRWKGGTSGKSIIEAATDARKNLIREHGKGLSRDTIRDVDHAIAKADEECNDHDYAGALKALKKVGDKSQEWPEALKSRVETARKGVIEKAEARLEEVAKLEVGKARRELRKLIHKLKGTGLEEKAEAILESL